MNMMKNNIWRLCRKKDGKDIDTIASELEEEAVSVKPLYDDVVAATPDYKL